MSTELCHIFEKYKSDKSLMLKWHNYSLKYYEMFNHLRDEPILLFEVGILNGSSLRGWKEFFRKGLIYGADIDRNRFFYEDRINCYYCNQDEPQTILNMWENPDLKNIQFDIIIDDGKHEHNANLNFLVNSFSKLKNNGTFIIEDLILENYSLFNEKKSYLEKQHNMKIELLEIPFESNSIDNRLAIIKRNVNDSI